MRIEQTVMNCLFITLHEDCNQFQYVGIHIKSIFFFLRCYSTSHAFANLEHDWAYISVSGNSSSTFQETAVSRYHGDPSDSRKPLETIRVILYRGVVGCLQLRLHDDEKGDLKMKSIQIQLTRHILTRVEKTTSVLRENYACRHNRGH